MEAFSNYEVWWVTGAQLLYGGDAVVAVDGHSTEMVNGLNASGKLPVKVVYKGTANSSKEVEEIFKAANNDSKCIGVITWMHTFSPAKMWIHGLQQLKKPLLHFHTQYNKEIPWDTMDMDFMNLNQSAHGDREFGHICSRMRIRLTDNGMTGAEDDVNGQTLDLVISTADASDGYMVKVNASAADRGTVSLTPEAERYEGGTQLKACAQPLGNAKFVCWREGRQVVSLDTAYTFNVNHETTLTAYFSPKTSDVPDGIGQVVSESGALVEVEAGSQYINIVTDAPVQDVSVYSVGGALVAQSASKRVSVSGLTAGSYIVKVQTSGKNTTAKVFIK